MKEAVQRRPWPNCLTRLADSRIAGLYISDKRQRQSFFGNGTPGGRFNFDYKLQMLRNLKGNGGLELLNQLWFQFVRPALSLW
ncbi:hypothetical protein RESH_00967 [Rhodopirellula europaea SH398]|uniref:Uncharacterized protein n=1 Tax=Rhodopirellula europaea SH398 TaxID=1263868 RepID=M5SL68_9BACT|nr:hypothetical protein RESH_00967 [Rhodopirellula europaea SH398]